MKAARIDSEEK